MPKVTVYIPTHNYGKFIKRCIGSVLAQKFSDWELVVINDGSTDNTAELLRVYNGNKKIRIIQQEKKGLTTTNNIALRLSQGEYIMRLDADDYLDENALLVLSNILDTHPQVGLVYPDYYRMDEEGEIIDIERRKRIGKQDRLLDMPAHGACTMIRKSCLLDLGGYDETVPCHDGYELWLRFIEKYKPYNVNIPLFYYRQHPASLSQDKEKILNIRQRIKRNFVKNKVGKTIPKVLAIVPARKTWYSAPDYAMRLINAKPLIYYTLSEASKTALLDRIVLVANDKDILKYGRSFKRVICMKRPDELSLLNSRIEPTVNYVLRLLKKKNGYAPDAVMLLYPHAPLRKKMHIEKAIDTMVIFNTDSVVSVCEDANFFYQHSEWGLRPLFKKRLLRLERDALFRDNGAIYLSKIKAIKKNNFLGDKVGHITMLPQESIKADTLFNNWLTEKIIKEWKKES